MGERKKCSLFEVIRPKLSAAFHLISLIAAKLISIDEGGQNKKLNLESQDFTPGGREEVYNTKHSTTLCQNLRHLNWPVIFQSNTNRIFHVRLSTSFVLGFCLCQLLFMIFSYKWWLLLLQSEMLFACPLTIINEPLVTKGALQSATVLLVITTTKIRGIRIAKLREGSQNGDFTVGNLLTR